MARCNQWGGREAGESCIRSAGHPGDCDPQYPDFQVWGYGPGMEASVAISHVYRDRALIEIVRRAARKQLPGFHVIEIRESVDGSDIDLGRDRETPTRVISNEEAIDFLRTLGWQ